MTRKACALSLVCIVAGCGGGLGKQQYYQAALGRVEGRVKNPVSRCLIERASMMPGVSFSRSETGPEPANAVRLRESDWTAASEESTGVSWQGGPKLEVLVYPTAASAADAYRQLRALPPEQKPRGKYSRQGVLIVKWAGRAPTPRALALLSTCEQQARRIRRS